MIVVRTRRFLLLKCDDCGSEGPLVICKHVPLSAKAKAKLFSPAVCDGLPLPNPKTAHWICGHCDEIKAANASASV